MKKNLLSLLVFSGFAILSTAQQIPVNLGLESWSNDSPDNWVSSNLAIAIGANQSVFEETANPSEGTSYARLITVECSFCPFVDPSATDTLPGLIRQAVPFNGTVTSITVDVRASMLNNDKGVVMAILTQNGTYVDGGTVEISNQATWTTITIPFTGASGDTLALTAASSGSPLAGNGFVPTGAAEMGSELWVDNWVFNGTTGTLSIDKVTNNNLRIYPNPTSEFIHIETDFTLGAIELYDGFGRLVKNINLAPGSNLISVSDLPVGSYLVRIRNTDETDARIQRIIISR